MPPPSAVSYGGDRCFQRLTCVGTAVLLLLTLGCSDDHANGRALPPPTDEDEGLIVFDDDTKDVWRVAADGTDRRRLTSNEAQEFDPSWSPDGREIAYRSEVVGNSEIYVMEADGTKKRNVTRNAGSDYSPSWSPRGNQIAFTSDRGGGRNDIYVMNTDGSGVRRVTANAATDEYPTWAPEGKRIAFVSDRDGRWEIYVIDVGRSNEHRLTQTGGKLPAWSPDGRWIAFQGPAPGSSESEHYDYIWLVTPDGSRAHAIARGLTPAWAPSGDAVLAATVGGLAVLRLDGTVQRYIVAGPALFANWVDPHRG